MTTGFDFIVVGRGLMGVASARHLAQAGARVAMVGPDEPVSRASHTAPFASHHDAGRITRHLAHDADWSRLSTRSIEQYEFLETESGLPIFTASGAVMSGPATGLGAGLTKAFLHVADALDIEHEYLDDATLPARLPFFEFPPGTLAALETAGGYINPRNLRAAEEMLAETAGAQIIRATVSSLAPDGVTLCDGGHVSGDHVVVATGGYAFTDGILPDRPAMKVYARTIAFAEVDEAEAARLTNMPSLIFIPEGQDYDLYLLPPIRYPDGKLYLKIGGEDESALLQNNAQMADWFRSDGTKATAKNLLSSLYDVMPGVAIRSSHSASCVVSFTATRYPYIERLTDRLTILTGGNGAGAKCCDELGRLGARAALGQPINTEGYDADFGAVFETG